MADPAPQRLADYQALVDLAECECALVQAGRVDELPELQAEWRARLELLEQPPPDGAELLLRRALSVAEQSAEGMVELQRTITTQLAEADGSRKAGRAYRPDTGPSRGQVDTDA